MEKTIKTKPRYAPSIFLGIIILFVGIYMLLISTNLIKTGDSGFKFGRLPVIFSSFFFLWFGVLIILYNLNKIKIGKISSKVFFLISLILLIIPVNIIFYKSMMTGLEKTLLLIVIIVLYVIGFYILMLLIKNIIKNKNPKGHVSRES